MVELFGKAALHRLLLASSALSLIAIGPSAAEPLRTRVGPFDTRDWTVLSTFAEREVLPGLMSGPAPIRSLAPQGPAAAPIATLTVSSAAQVPGAPQQQVRWSPSFPTFTYLTDNTNGNFTAPADQPWMATRPQLDGTFTANQKLEFNANWGNLAVGQAAALNRGLTGAGVTVAVIDTGIDASYVDPNNPSAGFASIHPEFVGRLDTRSGRALEDGTIDGALMDELIRQGAGHGTHVAGTIAANQDGVGTVGIAPGANVVALKGLFEGDTSSALSYAAEQADIRVINGSYGPVIAPGTLIWSTEFSSCAGNCLTAEYTAVRKALAAGKVLVYANGNDRMDSPVMAQNPSGVALYPFMRPAHANTGVYDDNGTGYDFSALGSLPGRIISVANIGVDLRVSADSNLCGVTASWCLSGPGGGVEEWQNLQNAILSTVPRALVSPYVPQFGPGPDNVGYSYFTGTSMATPHVTGVTAVLIGAYPGYTASEVVDLMFSTAQDLGAPGIDMVYGHGFVRLDRALDGPTTLAAAADVAVAAQQTTYWSQPLVTDGAFTKSGDGILTVSGRTTAQGSVTVNAGTFAVDGTFLLSGPGTLTVGAGGAVAGFGAIVGDTTIGGLLSPGKMANVQDLIDLGFLAPGATVTGNAPGALTFAGNVTLQPGATTRIDVDGSLQVPGGPGTFDRIVVVGSHTFAANGRLVPVLTSIAGNTFTPVVGERFTFVDGQGGATVTGSFTAMTQPTTGLGAGTRLDVIYAPSSLALVATPASLQQAAAGANGQAVATALDQKRPEAGLRPDAAVAPIYDALYASADAAGYANAFDTLSGQGQAAVPGAVLGAFAGIGNVIADRQAFAATGNPGAQAGLPSIAFAYGREGPSVAARNELPPQVMAADPSAVAAVPAGQWSVWGQAYGRWSRVGDRGAAPGASSNAGGFVVGVDRFVSPDLLAGAAFGFTRTQTGSAGSSATADTYAGAVYASWMPGAWVVDGRMAAGPATIGSTRTLAFPGLSASASGSTSGWGALAAGEIGYRVALGAATVKPYVGLTAQSFTRNGFTESSAFGLSFSEETFTRLTSAVGATATTTVRAGEFTIAPMAKLAWLHDLRDDALVTSAALLDVPFQIGAAAPGRDAAVLGLGLSAWRNESLRVFAAYSGEWRTNASSHELTGGLRLSW